MGGQVALTALSHALTAIRTAKGRQDTTEQVADVRTVPGDIPSAWQAYRAASTARSKGFVSRAESSAAECAHQIILGLAVHQRPAAFDLLRRLTSPAH